MRRAAAAPVVGLIALVLTVAVVTMHQMGSGHFAATVGSDHVVVSVEGHPGNHLDGHVGSASGGSTGDVGSEPTHGCEVDCILAGNGAGGTQPGQDMTLLCLAIVPLLILLVLGRGGPLLGYWPVWPGSTVRLSDLRFVAAGWSRPTPVRLCVLRT